MVGLLRAFWLRLGSWDLVYNLRSKTVSLEQLFLRPQSKRSDSEKTFQNYNFFSNKKGDYDIRTPLHVACASGKHAVAKFLIKILSKEEAGKQDRWGRTSADDAVSYLMMDDVNEEMKMVVKLLAEKEIHPTGATGKAGGASSSVGN